MRYIITGIGTDVGKTIVSAIIAEHLNATYWKPIQAGDLENSDSIRVASLTKNVKILEERHKLTEPLSPHAAANIDGIEIKIEHFKLPNVEGALIIEGAGGLLVPVNNEGITYADIFQFWNLPVIVVSRHYLGSINHTLMTIEILKSRNIKIEGIMFVGDKNETSEEIINSIAKVPVLGRIPVAESITPEFILEQSKRLNI